MLNWQHLHGHAEDLRRTYVEAKPFPHVVIDYALSEPILLDAWRAWPGDDAVWTVNQRGKRHMSTEIPTPLAAVVRAFNSQEFVGWLAAITSIPDLSPDFSLGGAGLHETAAGGHLPLHVDFNRQGDLYRRLNVLLFMNLGWQDDWQGMLELVDHPKKTKERIVISPQFNRLVIAESSDRSWHGHPNILCCPPTTARRSITTYYYSRSPHPSYREDHSTKYVLDKKQLRRQQRDYQENRGE